MVEKTVLMLVVVVVIISLYCVCADCNSCMASSNSSTVDCIEMETTSMQLNGNITELQDLKCSACASNANDGGKIETFPNAECLWAHIAITHSLWIPFECVLCPLMFMPTTSMLKRHYEQIHPDKIPKAVFTYDEKRKVEIERIFLESRMLSNDAVHISYSATQTTGNDILETGDISPPPLKRSTSDSEEGGGEEENGMDDHKTTVLQPPLSPVLSVADVDSSFEMKVDELDRSIEGKTPKRIRARSSSNKWARPSKKTVLGTPKSTSVCSLCSALLSANNRSAHIWHNHMYGRRFSCHDCDYSASMPNAIKKHVRLKHGRSSKDGNKRCWADHTSKMQLDYERQFGAAFGEYYKANSRSFNSPSMSPHLLEVGAGCRLCKRAVAYNYRDDHLWQNHMSRKRYSCAQCEHSCRRLCDIKEHVRTAGHGMADDGVYWRNNIDRLSDEYKATYAAAYSNFSKTSSSF